MRNTESIVRGSETVLAARQGEDKCGAGVEFNSSSCDKLKLHNFLFPGVTWAKVQIRRNPKFGDQ